jgi:hypothetical protein
MDRLSPTRSPSKYTTAEAFSPQIYGNYPILDSVLLQYLDIESLVQRHQVNSAAFETREALYLLAQRFALPPSTTFQAFLNSYDAKYPTVRSYSLPGANPKAIILKAAEAGELQAFYLGLRLNPEYKNPKLLKLALRRAAQGGHPVMIDLIKDLGGTSFRQEVRGTVEGGHLEKLKLLIAQRPRLGQRFLSQLTNDAARSGHLATFKYLTTLWTPLPSAWNNLSFSAGASGDQSMIDYVISQYGDNYTEVILGAISGGHLELVMRYMEQPGLNYLYIFSQAIRFDYLDLAKLVARDHRIDRDLVNDLMPYVSVRSTYEIIEYLISLGGDNYHGLVLKLAMRDQIKLFKRYYLSPGVDYLETFEEGLKSLSLKVVKFMLEKALVPTTEDELNRYLDLAVLNPELIALLFSLGATDYHSLVEKALIHGDLELAKKYFDRAPTIKLNSIFKECTNVPVYQYLLSRGRIKQKTVDATLDILEEFNGYVQEEQYLRSLILQDGGFSRSSSSSSSSSIIESSSSISSSSSRSSD